jgi:glucose/arabinose dehydrogenase
MTRPLRTAVLFAAVLFAPLSARADTPTPTATPTTTDLPTPPVSSSLSDPLRAAIRKGPVHIKLESVATGLTAPVWGITAPGAPGRLFVVDQMGTLWAVDLTSGAKTVFLDVSARLITLGVFGPNTFDERGFLGLAFAPDYQTSGLLYTYTSEPVNGAADFSTIPPAETADCQSVVAEWHVPSPNDVASVVDPGSRREVLRVDKPQFNHNAGALNFGPDGRLYISFGDGGGADDSDGETFIAGEPQGGMIVTSGHGVIGNGQNTGVVLGKILRIDPLGSNSANGKYGIPADNPFVGHAGFAGEIFAYGLRNPFRFSFDSANGALYAADVGQNELEEVDVITKGGNYGWRFKEGRFFFGSDGAGLGYVSRHNPGVPKGLLDPVAQYDHSEGLAVIGGFVYHGTRIPRLVGHYVFGDFARTFTNDGRLFYLRGRNLVTGPRIRRTSIAELRIDGQDALHLALLGFGQDASGEIYVLANGNSVPFGTTGVVLRIAPPS